MINGWLRNQLRNTKTSYMFVYDFAVLGGEQGSIPLTAIHGALPNNFILQSVFIDVLTPLSSAGAATGALTTGESAGDLQAATAVNGAPWSTGGNKATPVLMATIATWIKTSAIRSPALVVATADLDAGKFNVFMEGYLSA